MPERKFSVVERTRKIGMLLQALRVGRGYSLREAAKRAECSPSFLAQIEKGRSSPSLDSLERMAEGFDLSLVELLNLARDRGASLFMARDQKGQTVVKWPAGSLSHLLPFHVPATMSLLVLDLKPGGRTPVRAARQAMKELGVVLEGEVSCEVAGESYRLTRGESLYFDLISPHFWKNLGQEPARVLLVNPNFTPVFDIEEP